MCWWIFAFSVSHSHQPAAKELYNSLILIRFCAWDLWGEVGGHCPKHIQDIRCPIGSSQPICCWFDARGRRVMVLYRTFNASDTLATPRVFHLSRFASSDALGTIRCQELNWVWPFLGMFSSYCTISWSPGIIFIKNLLQCSTLKFRIFTKDPFFFSTLLSLSNTK